LKQSFVIVGRLDSMNDLIRACRTNPHVGAKMKRDNEALVALYARRLTAMRSPVRVHFTWVEKNARRDPDNVRAGAKFILDQLVRSGILSDDSQAHIAGLSDTFAVDKANPRVEVTLEEA
jgi:Holliday junction resolvase RusA-like endonuclease